MNTNEINTNTNFIRSGIRAINQALVELTNSTSINNALSRISNYAPAHRRLSMMRFNNHNNYRHQINSNRNNHRHSHNGGHNHGIDIGLGLDLGLGWERLHNHLHSHSHSHSHLHNRGSSTDFGSNILFEPDFDDEEEVEFDAEDFFNDYILENQYFDARARSGSTVIINGLTNREMGLIRSEEERMMNSRFKEQENYSRVYKEKLTKQLEKMKEENNGYTSKIDPQVKVCCPLCGVILGEGIPHEYKAINRYDLIKKIRESKNKENQEQNKNDLGDVKIEEKNVTKKEFKDEEMDNIEVVENYFEDEFAREVVNEEVIGKEDNVEKLLYHYVVNYNNSEVVGGEEGSKKKSRKGGKGSRSEGTILNMVYKKLSKIYDCQAPYQLSLRLSQFDVELSQKVFFSKCGHVYCGRCVNRILNPLVVEDVGSRGKRAKRPKRLSNLDNPDIAAPKKCVSQSCGKVFRKNFTQLYMQ
ncbi:SUMO-targeted ubiquitin ligase complex subunit SLX5 ASCRUDRAFT_80870 [Ascoidea rubescens DSM 1968]|uniref:Zinc finger C3HC4 RING-type domain-containing protein n=1 Tax=Ascoidea rubescens DSM 1968 TaxID=1344418 RepID=A0A1D2VHK5_9ASCO|nr:hypothetical protein ASCRUDRAFT_80870 [Ascoidea rubescens DSM 1968]ODV61116.1 hypothetical protein ASCRUDRAFT_80870 [Ascoidea rubescens DSM 1968]